MAAPASAPAPDFAGQVKSALRTLRRELADVGSANSPEVKAAARVLRRELRKQVSKRYPVVKGRTVAKRNGERVPARQPSAPGAPPGRVTGGLAGSLGTEVVVGVRRVGFGSFKSRLLFTGSKAGPGGKGVVAPRDLFTGALERALPQMEDVAVSALQQRIEGGKFAAVDLGTLGGGASGDAGGDA